MHIVQVAAEFAPIAKAGGLGEVLVGLSRELVKNRQRVEVILPKYDWIPTHSLQIDLAQFSVPENTMWKGEFENCPLRLLETHHPDRYFHRGKIYGCEDDVARFLYFSKAVLEYLTAKNEPIDVLHLHDWHVAALAPLVKAQKKLRVDSIVLSIHNIEYQGQCSLEQLQAIGWPKDLLHNVDHQYNLLKSGLEYADAIVPVSPTYAQEILTPHYGFGLDATLRTHKNKIHGILNGIDLTLWNPADDVHLEARYDASKLKAKQVNKAKLASRFPLDVSKGPWFGAITRLVPQKGPELLEEALREVIRLGGTFALLGSSPMSNLQNHFEKLAKQYKGHPQVLLHLDYDEALAHQLYAALDFLLVPSHFEPCGLTQLIAMRYGTIPIVRATGGLKDTVFDAKNGFVFDQLTPEAFRNALQRAFRLWQTEPLAFQELARRGMQADIGWARPAQEYLRLYRKLSLG